MLIILKSKRSLKRNAAQRWSSQELLDAAKRRITETPEMPLRGYAENKKEQQEAAADENKLLDVAKSEINENSRKGTEKRKWQNVKLIRTIVFLLSR
jgi:hypothetical protein